jgi:hypothetical protein
MQLLSREKGLSIQKIKRERLADRPGFDWGKPINQARKYPRVSETKSQMPLMKSWFIYVY